MKVGILFSGGKDSVLAAWIARKENYELGCLITIESSNEDSFMFHTPSITKVKKQAEKMDLPLVVVKTSGEKELELKDLENAIEKAVKKYDIEGIVTGAVNSVYQSTRIHKICNKLNLHCFNPLWQKNQFEILEDLIKENFEVVVVGVFAYPLNQKFLGKKIDNNFIEDMRGLQEKYKINPAGEGGEFESFVLNCPLFKSTLKINDFKDIGEKNSWRRELEI